MSVCVWGGGEMCVLGVGGGGGDVCVGGRCGGGRVGWGVGEVCLSWGAQPLQCIDWWVLYVEQPRQCIDWWVLYDKV